MTYSQGSPGYPPANQPTTNFSAPTQHFGRPDAGPGTDGPSKLPAYLLIASAVLGLLIYLVNFGPIFQVTTPNILGQGGTTSGSTLGIGIAVIAALLAGLLAAVSLLPKQRNYVAVVAAVSVLAFLLVIAELVQKPSEAAIGWALYALIVLSLLQAGASVASLLYDAGILNPPTPRPKYDQQQQYGQYGGPSTYYGQPPSQSHQPQHHLGQQGGQQGGQQHQQSSQQRPGYPSQYGSYPGGPNTGGFPAAGQQGGPPTPPTGFPTYGQPQQPQQSGSGQSTQAQQPQSSSQQSPPSSTS